MFPANCILENLKLAFKILFLSVINQYLYSSVINLTFIIFLVTDYSCALCVFTFTERSIIF
jgi:type III secretory pathway component EscU